jgi:hypothetical protein
LKESKSFILHKDSLDILQELTDEQAGQLFKSIWHYQNGEQIELSPLLRIAFTPFKNQFGRDVVAYQERCQKNSDNAKKRWEKNATVCDRIGTVAKDAYSKSDSKSDSKNKNKNNSKNINIDSFDENIKPSVELIISHREDMNKPITKRGVDMLLKKLDHYAKHNDITFDDALDFWLGEKWQGIDIDYKYPFRTVEKKEKSFAQIANDMPNPWDEHGNLIMYDDNGKRLEVLQ